MCKVKVYKRLVDGRWQLIGWVQDLAVRATGPEETAIQVASDNMDDLMVLWDVGDKWQLMRVV